MSIYQHVVTSIVHGLGLGEGSNILPLEQGATMAISDTPLTFKAFVLRSNVCFNTVASNVVMVIACLTVQCQRMHQIGPLTVMDHKGLLPLEYK